MKKNSEIRQEYAETADFIAETKLMKEDYEELGVPFLPPFLILRLFPETDAAAIVSRLADGYEEAGLQRFSGTEKTLFFRYDYKPDADNESKNMSALTSMAYHKKGYCNIFRGVTAVDVTKWRSRSTYRDFTTLLSYAAAHRKDMSFVFVIFCRHGEPEDSCDDIIRMIMTYGEAKVISIGSAEKDSVESIRKLADTYGLQLSDETEEELKKVCAAVRKSGNSASRRITAILSEKLEPEFIHLRRTHPGGLVVTPEMIERAGVNDAWSRLIAGSEEKKTHIGFDGGKYGE